MKGSTIAKIKALKPAVGFSVRTEYERQDLLRTAKHLKQMGLIDFDLVTRFRGGRYRVAAI